MKRGILNLGGASPQFRISKQGFSADSANLNDFLFHETLLYQRVIAVGVLSNPGAGSSFTTSVALGVAGALNSHVEFAISQGGGVFYSPTYFIYSGFGVVLVDNIVWTVSPNVLTVNFGNAKNLQISYVVYKV